MVKDTGQFQSLHSSTHSFISTSNDSTSPTVGEGTVILTQILTLNSVLVVPSLEHNLLSVGQITSALNCTCCNPFLGPHLKNTKKFKKIYYQKKYNSEKCQSALKMFKN